MNYSFKEDFQRGLVPNGITLAGILTLPGIFLSHSAGIIWLAIAYLSVGWFCDWLDGFIARRFNMQSKIGDFFDPLADKIFTTSLLIYFWDRIPMVAGIGIISFGVLATVGRIIILSAGKKLKIEINVMANMAGKFKTNFEKAGIAGLLLLDLFALHWPTIPVTETLSTLTLILLWGSLPLAVISFINLWRKLRVLYCSYN